MGGEDIVVNIREDLVFSGVGRFDDPVGEVVDRVVVISQPPRKGVRSGASVESVIFGISYERVAAGIAGATQTSAENEMFEVGGKGVGRQV